MMNFNAMKNSVETIALHADFLAALRKYKTLARGKQFTDEKGNVTDPTAENLRMAQEAIDGTLSLYNEQLTIRAYYGIITAEKPFTAWAENPDFFVARVTKEYEEGKKAQAVNLFTMVKAAKKNGLTIKNATDVERSVYALQFILQKAITPKDTETVSKTSVKKALTACLHAMGLCLDKEARSIDAHYALFAVSGMGRNRGALKDVPENKAADMVATVYAAMEKGLKYRFNSDDKKAQDKEQEKDKEKEQTTKTK